MARRTSVERSRQVGTAVYNQLPAEFLFDNFLSYEFAAT